jgi:hypothetical protein
VAAEETIIASLAKTRPNKHLVFVTIVPRGMTYLPGQFADIDVLKANRSYRRVIIGSAAWLKDVLDRK